MGAMSYSVKLGDAIVKQIQTKYPGSVVEEVDLNSIDIPHLTPETLQTFFTPGDSTLR